MRITAQKADGETDGITELAYDVAGRLSQATSPDAVVEGILASLQLAWQSGRLSSLGIGSHQPLQFSHTAAGEEQRRSNGSGFTLRHEWSPTGLLQRQPLGRAGLPAERGTLALSLRCVWPQSQ
ncbi:hypothetical protein QT13_20995 [Pectobacterium brasiliense]|nr:hypothetical protein [Pectobacterium brasiliense]KHS62459.1 hypothetical protein QT13_20995 [Pectobacterium brasiliense]KHS82769.1 hypothetical protein RC83_19345 [Pectobacterium brasiliense]UDQ75045.1 hypothetical protein LJQ72_16015 [Pectobacterium brasiliense]